MAKKGAYYVWTRDEVKTALWVRAPGLHDGDFAAEVLSGSETVEPNAEGGHYVLHEPHARAERAAALKFNTGTARDAAGSLAHAAARCARKAAGAAPG